MPVCSARLTLPQNKWMGQIFNISQNHIQQDKQTKKTKQNRENNIKKQKNNSPPTPPKKKKKALELPRPPEWEGDTRLSPFPSWLSYIPYQEQLLCLVLLKEVVFFSRFFWVSFGFLGLFSRFFLGFPGDFFIFGLTKNPFGDYFLFFLKQIQVWLRGLWVYMFFWIYRVYRLLRFFLGQ